MQPLWKIVQKKLKIELPYDLAYPLLGIHPKELISGSQRAIHSRVYCGIIHNSLDMEAL